MWATMEGGQQSCIDDIHAIVLFPQKSPEVARQAGLKGKPYCLVRRRGARRWLTMRGGLARAL